jgi:acyl-homoserine lactone acylase PvdQ
VTYSHGPVFRHLVDLAVADSSLGVVAPGNSGDPASGHARDHLRRWADHQYVAFHLDWDRIERIKEGELRLEP